MNESENEKDRPKWVDGVLEFKTKDGFMRIVGGNSQSPYAKWLEKNLPRYQSDKESEND